MAGDSEVDLGDQRGQRDKDGQGFANVTCAHISQKGCNCCV